MSHGEFAAFLSESLDALRVATPSLFAGVCDRMDGWSVDFRVGDSDIALRFEAGAFRIESPGAESAVLVATTKHTILDLVDGHLALEDAIWTDRFHLRGELASLSRFFDSLQLYLQGAVRIPGFASLLDRYRGRGVVHMAAAEDSA